MGEINNYSESIRLLKSAILPSRYKAASSANKELLLLYFAVGKFISGKINKEKWGAKVIDTLSTDLQAELPGLRGFSASGIKRMRFFFESWEGSFLIGPTLLDQIEIYFSKLSFSHHLEIIQDTNSLEEKRYYIRKAATEFWSLTTLKHHLKNKSFSNSGSLPKAFKGLLPDAETLKKLMD